MSITTNESGVTRALHVHFPKHQPHWKAYGRGSAHVEFTAHKEGLWLAIDTVETAEPGGIKRTMITLDAVQLQALKALLLNLRHQVVVEVSGGVAEVTNCPANVDVQIIDHDNLEAEAEEVPNWTTEVIADASGEWVGNGLTFATEEEAARYVADLYCRWTSVRETRVVKTDKPVTHVISGVDGYPQIKEVQQ